MENFSIEKNSYFFFKQELNINRKTELATSTLFEGNQGKKLELKWSLFKNSKNYFYFFKNMKLHFRKIKTKTEKPSKQLTHRLKMLQMCLSLNFWRIIDEIINVVCFKNSS